MGTLLSGRQLGSLVQYSSWLWQSQWKLALSEVPDDSYPVPRMRLPWWAKIFDCRGICSTFCLGRTAFQDIIVGMRTAQKNNMPTVCIERDIEQAIQPSVAHAQAEIHWCWGQETSHFMNQHPREVIEGDPLIVRAVVNGFMSTSGYNLVRRQTICNRKSGIRK